MTHRTLDTASVTCCPLAGGAEFWGNGQTGLETPSPLGPPGCCAITCAICEWCVGEEHSWQYAVFYLSIVFALCAFVLLLFNKTYSYSSKRGMDRWLKARNELPSTQPVSFMSWSEKWSKKMNRPFSQWLSWTDRAGTTQVFPVKLIRVLWHSCQDESSCCTCGCQPIPKALQL